MPVREVRSVRSGENPCGVGSVDVLSGVLSTEEVTSSTKARSALQEKIWRIVSSPNVQYQSHFWWYLLFGSNAKHSFGSTASTLSLLPNFCFGRSCQCDGHTCTSRSCGIHPPPPAREFPCLQIPTTPAIVNIQLFPSLPLV